MTVEPMTDADKAITRLAEYVSAAGARSKTGVIRLAWADAAWLISRGNVFRAERDAERSLSDRRFDEVVELTGERVTLMLQLADAKRALKAAEAARDAALARAMPPWHPIETAPHGQLVLLYCPDRGPANPERIELDYASRGSRNAVGSTVSRHAWATMWQPLPDLPTPIAAQEG